MSSGRRRELCSLVREDVQRLSACDFLSRLFLLGTIMMPPHGPKGVWRFPEVKQGMGSPINTH